MEASSLIQRRGRVKGTSTRFKTFSDGITETTSIEDINSRLEKLEDLWKEFKDIEDSLLLLPNQTSECEEFENKYFDTRANFLRAIKSKVTTQPGANSTTYSNEQQNNYSGFTSNEQFSTVMNNFLTSQQTFFENFARNSRQSQINNSSPDVRLPRMQIPSFSGDFKEWPSFADLFETSVDRNEHLSSCQKLQYLKGLLQGEAASVIRHLTITEVNYIEAWEKLKARYNKKRNITSAMIKTFCDVHSTGLPTPKHLRSLYDTFDEVIRGLRALGEGAQARDPWLIHIALNKLDPETKQLWFKESSDKDFPSFDDFLIFLNRRCDAMEISGDVSKKVNNTRSFHASSSTPVQSPPCPACNGDHLLFQCPLFKGKSADDRKGFVISKAICFNCLRPGHSVSSCRSKNRCTLCKRQHHSLLHGAGNRQNSQSPSQLNQNQSLHSICSDSASTPTQFPTSSINIASEAPINPQETSSFNSIIGNRNICQSIKSFALLPTALVNVKDSFGRTHSCRVLLDSGSQVSFISENLTQRLTLKREYARLSINGVAGTKTGCTRGKVTIRVSSRFDNSKYVILQAYIMPKLTSLLPSVKFCVDHWHYLKDCNLADPSFNEPDFVDIIIGADKFFEILSSGQIHAHDKYPIAQETIFGWVLGGNYFSLGDSAMSFHTKALSDVECILKRFWEDEYLGNTENLVTAEEELCENHFQTNTFRNKDGKYVVSLPFKSQAPPLGCSLKNAIKRFHAVERRFERDPTYKEQYIKFMTDYEALGHMTVIPDEDIKEAEYNNHFYLPHHAVFKTSPVPKIRVVFDGSAKSSSGVALNETLMVGPVVQRDLFSILTSFRKHAVAFTADIEKMYRQVLISRKDRDFQRIVWRENPTDSLKHYRLSTLTYGTSSAPFLATRVLKQIALDHKASHSDVAEIIENDFYVDDLLSGAKTITQALEFKSSLIKILTSNGFNLTKWTSNHEDLAKRDSALNESVPIKDHTETTKVLGIAWNPASDNFSFCVSRLSNETPTKRRLLSESSRLFDPLGLLAPITISIKILYQQLWLANLDWDDPLPSKFSTKWDEFRATLPMLSQIRIPRLIFAILPKTIQFHGFSDASELAYSAVIYCRSTSELGHVAVNLVAAKTKVAPIKQVSLPRLELCAALLLKRLMLKVVQALSLGNMEIWTWTDSSIVLSWLSDTPRRWTSYVGNRTAEILSDIPRKHWRHVPSTENPADIASRGITPRQLIGAKLWWHGPPWLLQNPSSWPSREFSANINIEQRKTFVVSYHKQISDCLLSCLVTRFSSWSKFKRVLSYCIRFIKNCREPKSLRKVNYITGEELTAAENIIIKWVQSQHFSEDIKRLMHGKNLSAKSQLNSLNPYLDENQILRVGGRLENAKLTTDSKHPKILPKDHEITKLLVREMHKQYLHPGITLLINIIRQKYWIVRVRHLVKNITHKCIVCFRHRLKTTNQLMGNLPADRVVIGRPFLRSGVDFAGPINLCTKMGRGAKSSKGYIALFVCFTTKALHLEVVSSLSSEAFLAALRRFVSRRGIPSDLYSDNGTNFVGTSRRLLRLFNEALSSFSKDPLIHDFLSQKSISWHFIPPASPHMGGLWEAGIKSVKSHLHRVIGEKLLSYEEMLTLLSQIEAVLNSRPLCPLSDETDSLKVLTPSHFLIGDVLTAIPEPNLEQVNISRLGRWQQVQAMTQGFWRRWSRDYLTSLQQRPKWKTMQPNIKRDDLVILREDGVPPSRWVIGRIENVYPGADDIVRVALVRTSKGVYKRSINRIYKLPLE